MVCAQLIRNVVIILLLEVSFSFVIANGSKPGNPKQPKPVKCAAISIPNGRIRILSTDKHNPQPGKVIRGKQPISIGRSILYICNKGYQIHGNNALTCKPNGNWSQSPPACLAIPETHAPPQEVPTPTIRSTVTDLLTTEEVETTTSGNPAVDEGLTTASDGLPSVVTLEKAKTSEAFRVITITVAARTPPLPIPTQVASSTVELHLPTSRSTTLKAEESTVVPSSTPLFSSFPDDAMESDTTAFDNLDRITRSSLDELTDAQSTSTTKMFRQDEETKEPDTRVTETHRLFSEKPDEELEEKVSTSDAYETTSQKPFETEDSVVSSVEMVSETEEEDDTTPEARDHSSVSDLGLKKIEDDDAEMQSPTLESVSHYTAVPQELLTVQSNSPRIKVPIDEVETRRTPEDSLSSFTMESEDFNLPFEHDFTETDSKGQRSLIVTHFSTKTTTESSSDETGMKIPTNESKTGKPGSRSQPVLTTHVPPSKPSGYKSTPRSTPTVDSAAMTGGSSASSIVLIIIIVAAVIILVVLLVILGKAFLPKCTLLQKPCHEQGAVPYTAQNNQTDQVVLKGVNPMPENDRCTQV